MDKLDLVAEVMSAYSDCNGYKGERNLNYIASQPVNAKELAQLMLAAVPEGYNAFDPKSSIAQLTEFFGDGDDVQYFIARESSVCIYIKPTTGNIWLNRGKGIQIIKADEILFDADLMMFRVWWD